MTIITPAPSRFALPPLMAQLMRVLTSVDFPSPSLPTTMTRGPGDSSAPSRGGATYGLKRDGGTAAIRSFSKARWSVNQDGTWVSAAWYNVVGSPNTFSSNVSTRRPTREWTAHLDFCAVPAEDGPPALVPERVLDPEAELEPEQLGRPAEQLDRERLARLELEPVLFTGRDADRPRQDHVDGSSRRTSSTRRRVVLVGLDRGQHLSSASEGDDAFDGQCSNRQRLQRQRSLSLRPYVARLCVGLCDRERMRSES